MVKSLITIFNTQAISPSSDYFSLPYTEKESSLRGSPTICCSSTLVTACWHNSGVFQLAAIPSWSCLNIMLRDKLIPLLFRDPKKDDRLAGSQIRRWRRIWIAVTIGGGQQFRPVLFTELR